MIDRLKKEMLQAINRLAMRAALDKMRGSRQYVYPCYALDGARAELPVSAPLPAPQEDTSPDRVLAAPGWDSDSVGDPFSAEGPDDNLLGEDDDPFSSWPSLPSEKKSKEPAPEKEPDGGYIDFSLEGILDEALKVEDQGTDTSPKGKSAADDDRREPAEENAFSGILEDVLGTDPGVDSAEAPAPAAAFGEDDPFLAISQREEDTSPGKDEIDFVDEHFDAIGTDERSAPSSPLEDLARTQLSSNVDALLSGPGEKAQTSPEVRASPAYVDLDVNRLNEKPTRVVVPVHLSVDRDTPEMELEVTLEIKISRKNDQA